ncbi:filamentous hemagglutinin N-terminal domain-containing protein [Azonexus sp. R2A61]|uniref:two-partner secretion domain-containing protein n=1 Tax=Azonexus sp. R2A61 TaxID=2744443 RepID=UPI001F331ABF|nr:filamentous hemagglutinin N-terminal domain-containing protein [Azonexus sp. R2A61]
MKRASLNHTYRLVWNDILNAFVAVAEFARAKGKSGGRAVRLVAAGLVLGSLNAAGWASGTLPTGGTVVAGSGTIAQSGSAMTITQASGNMAIDWQSFSIGQGNSVNFVQPSASAVALNRVLGSDVSVIQGALTANGQVFLINPNGVLFSPSAQVNVGSLVASTLNMATADFMSGNYRFAGSSGNAIINQGNISAAPGGTIALIAAKIINNGSLTADGGNVLLGAGSRVTLDMGGPVKLQIENDTLETLIANGGAIRANGGTVLLTSQAADNLASSVINNTGLVEAQALATGEKGEIILFAHGGHTHVEGTLDATGGFVETSGKTLDIDVGTKIRAAEWLIDPVNVTIDSGNGAIGGASVGASVIADALSSGGGNTNVTIAADNNIDVNESIAWNANKLTLSAGNDINVNASLLASGSASLAFEYGQATASGAGSAYRVADGVDVLIPNPAAFTWKKGSGGSVKNLVFDNGFLRFGNGTEASLNSLGMLLQPWYFDNVSSGRNDWFPLTYSDYALDMAVGVGGTNNGGWNTSGVISYTSGGSNSSFTTAGQSINIAKYQEGVGTITATNTYTFGAEGQIKLTNAYTLEQNSNFLKTTTTINNISGADKSNVRIWIGTSDDWIAVNDSNYKTKGNIGASGFERIQNQNDLGSAILVSEDDPNSTTAQGAAILFYSTTPGTNTLFNNWGDFSGRIVQKDPVSSAISAYHDGSYAIFMNLGDVANAQSSSLTWFYAAAPVSQINNVINNVGQSAGVTPSTPSAPVSNIPEQAAISNVQGTIGQMVGNTASGGSTVSGVAVPENVQSGTAAASSLGGVPGASFGNNPLGTPNLSGGLAFLDVPTQPAGSGNAGPATGAQGSGVSPDAPAEQLPNFDATSGGSTPNGFMTVLRVAGGVNYGTQGDNNSDKNQ